MNENLQRELRSYLLFQFNNDFTRQLITNVVRGVCLLEEKQIDWIPKVFSHEVIAYHWTVGHALVSDIWQEYSREMNEHHTSGRTIKPISALEGKNPKDFGLSPVHVGEFVEDRYLTFYWIHAAVFMGKHKRLTHFVKDETSGEHMFVVNPNPQ